MSQAAPDQTALAALPASSEETIGMVLFEMAGKRFAVELAKTSEIIAQPDMTTMPFTPSMLKGVANLRGSVVPVIDLAEALKLDSTIGADDGSIIVCQSPEIAGLLVDRVETIHEAKAGDVRPLRFGQDTGVVTGTLGIEGWPESVLVISLDRLFEKGLPLQRGAERKQAPRKPKGAPRQADTSCASDRRLLRFECEGASYALPLSDLVEIAPLPRDLSAVAGCDEGGPRLMEHRGRPIPVFALADCLGTAGTMQARRGAESALTQTQYALILERRERDGARETFAVEVEPPCVPLSAPYQDTGQGSERGESTQLKASVGLVRNPDDGALITVLDPDILIEAHVPGQSGAGDDESDPLTRLGAGTEGSDMDGPTEGSDAIQIVVFRLDETEYALPIHLVQEILSLPDAVTRLPGSAPEVRGVMNLRGSVLVVIDARKRFGLPMEGRTQPQIIVVTEGSSATGYVVDEVIEVKRVPPSTIKPAQRLERTAGPQIEEVVELDGRLILLLPAEALSGGSEDEPAKIAEPSVAD
ncbi:MAG: chemotaxis protein CheW [Pseudomonadota bacterium]